MRATRTGVWLYRSSAETRFDHRYGGDHQHNSIAPPSSTITKFSDIRFTGDTEIYGFHADLSHLSENKHWKVGVKTELATMNLPE